MTPVPPPAPFTGRDLTAAEATFNGILSWPWRTARRATVPQLRILPKRVETPGDVAALLRYQRGESARNALWHAVVYAVLALCGLAGLVMAFW